MLIERCALLLVKVFNFYRTKDFTHSQCWIATPIVLRDFRALAGLSSTRPREKVSYLLHYAGASLHDFNEFN